MRSGARPTRHRLAALGAMLVFFGSGTRALAAAVDDGWIEGKIASMTLREKLGQMLMIDLKGQAFTPAIVRHLEAGEFGNVIFFEKNLVDEEQTRLFVKQLQDHAIVRRGIPLLTAIDQEGGQVNRLGSVTRFSLMRHSARTLGAVYDFAPTKAARLINRLTSDVASRMKRLGFNMNLAPVLDLTNDKHSYIYDRSYGGDPKAVSRITAAYAQVMDDHGIATTGKHFPNLSHTRADSHQALPTLERSLAELDHYEFVPFKRLRDDLGAVMVGHVMVPAIDTQYPTSISPKAIELLRKRIGFDGVIVTDDIKMKALADRYSLYEIVLRSVFAGVDLVIIAWDEQKQLEALSVLERAAKRGRLPEARIDASVRRILRLKQRYAR